MLNSLSISPTSAAAPPILVICDLQPDLLGSLNASSKQDLLDALSIVVEAARKHQWKIFYSALQFSSGYQRVPQSHKLYGAFAKLHQKLGDKAVHWFLEGWEGSQVLKEPAKVAPRLNIDTVVTREQHLPLELIQSILPNHTHSIRKSSTNNTNENEIVHDATKINKNDSAFLLENMNTSQKVYLTGAKASGSVQITAQMLMDQGFQVSCIDDAIQDDNPEKRQAILQHVLPIYGSVVSLQEFVEQMGGLDTTLSKESQQTFVEYYKRRQGQSPPKASQGLVTTKQMSKDDSKSSVPRTKSNEKKKKKTLLACNCGRRGHGAKYMELLLHRNHANSSVIWQTYPSQIWYEDIFTEYYCPLGKQMVDFCDEPEFSAVSMYLLGREWLDEKDKFLEIANSSTKNYMPQTYCFEKGAWKDGLAPPSSESKDGPWFVKEANKNLGGAAIHIVSKTSEIAQHLRFPNDRRYVVQAHIRDPLLTDDGKKTHIKFYVLLVCDADHDTSSWTLYTYKASLLSISPNPWSSTDLSHDTQVTIHRHPEPPEETNGWKQHWDEVYQKCKQGTAHIIQRAIAEGKLQSRKHQRKNETKSFQKQFEVLSVDWMPDTHGNVWVLECNLSPAIAQPEFEDPSHRDARRDYLMKHDETMLKEALEIVMPSSGDEPFDYGQWDFAGTFHSKEDR